jgi:hypothetical protein
MKTNRFLMKKKEERMNKPSRKMSANPYIFWGILLVLLLLLTYGCAAPQVAPSGFLSDYQRLKAEPGEEWISWWELPNVPWKKYKRLMIDPVEVRIDMAKAEREMKPEEMEKLANTLRRAVVEALKDRYPMSNQAGPDVLRLRTALTHLKPVSPAANIISAVVLMMPVDVGEAAVEVQFIDSQSGKILSELIASQRGSLMAVTEVWSRWAQVEAGFKEWAQKLRAALDEVHQGKK